MQILSLITGLRLPFISPALISFSLAFGIIKLLPVEMCLAENDQKTENANEVTRSSVSFLPTWRHMTPEAKRQFIAGYVRGWTDASGVTDIAIAYLRDKPAEALSGLERLKYIYDLSDVDPAKLVPIIDRFYKDPQNSQAALSLAVSVARDTARLGEAE